MENNHIRTRLLFFLLGLVLVAFGNALSIISTAGNGLWTAAALGLAQWSGVGISFILMVIGLIVIGINLLLSEHWSWLTVSGELLFVLLFSQLIHFFVTALSKNFTVPVALWLRIVLAIIGITIVCLGTSFYQRANLWMYPTDSLTTLLTSRFFNNHFAWAQLVAFVPPVILITATTFHLHAVVGVQAGTLFSLTCNGPLIAYFNKRACPFLRLNSPL
ncbi:hypothetical protein GHU05_02945 [Fructobacillus tropaeoli]|uniref:hypothetical protein n=1 Tax=Fructobacillus tropaeoli TaxID=709323 RepID=UPI0014561F6F|nr:hypothetical protein [Fructobacillus tropaeoli]NLS37890.1 hypothetical protein [Fructobacillus tropaeoli]